MSCDPTSFVLSCLSRKLFSSKYTFYVCFITFFYFFLNWINCDSIIRAVQIRAIFLFPAIHCPVRQIYALHCSQFWCITLPTSPSAYTINPAISSTRPTRNSCGILRQRTQACYQRDAKDEYACEHSIQWDDNGKENSDSIAFPTSLTVVEVAGHPQQTIGLVPFPRTYIDCKECSQAEKARPSTIVSYQP